MLAPSSAPVTTGVSSMPSSCGSISWVCRVTPLSAGLENVLRFPLGTGLGCPLSTLIVLPASDGTYAAFCQDSDISELTDPILVCEALWKDISELTDPILVCEALWKDISELTDPILVCEALCQDSDISEPIDPILVCEALHEECTSELASKKSSSECSVLAKLLVMESMLIGSPLPSGDAWLLLQITHSGGLDQSLLSFCLAYELDGGFR
eukprot:gene16971-20165_t